MDEHPSEEWSDRVDIDGFDLHMESVDEASPAHTALPPKVESWRRRSAMGAILTGFALGLREALEPQRDDPPIVVQVSGEPVNDLPVEAHIDDVHPHDSLVTIRSWMLEDRAAPDAADEEGGPGAALPDREPKDGP